MADDFKFDVFLSHNSKDKPAVETIARLLRDEYSLKAWLDKWNLVPGEAWQDALEDALDESQTFAVFLGPSGMGSWENEEMRTAIEDRVQDPKRRVVPVLLPGAPDNKDLKLPRFCDVQHGWISVQGWMIKKHSIVFIVELLVKHLVIVARQNLPTFNPSTSSGRCLKPIGF